MNKLVKRGVPLLPIRMQPSVIIVKKYTFYFLIIWLTCDFFNMVFGVLRVAHLFVCLLLYMVFGGVRVAHLFVCLLLYMVFSGVRVAHLSVSLLLLSNYVSLRSELRVVVSVTISA